LRPRAARGKTMRSVMMTLFICFLLCPASRLPAAETCDIAMDIPGWTADPSRETELLSAKGVKGTWTERTYRRNSDGHMVEIILMDGPGTSWWGVSGDISRSEDGPIGCGATFSTTAVCGFPAVMEEHPALGTSLVVCIDGDTTLTLETEWSDVDLESLALFFLPGENPQ